MIKVLEPNPPVLDIVESLEMLLQEAKEGKIRGIAVSIARPGGDSAHIFNIDEGAHQVISGLELVKHRIMKRCFRTHDRAKEQ